MADAAQALADLTEISSQIQVAAILDEEGKVVASTFTGAERADAFAQAAGRLLEAAAAVRAGSGGEELTQFEVATAEGSVFVVRDAGHAVAATTTPEPTVGLVFYDLKTCLRGVAQPDEESPGAKAKRSRRKTADDAQGDGDAT